jgi:hypothetical protein
LVGYGKKAFHKPPQALARKRYAQADARRQLEIQAKLLYLIPIMY